MKPVTLPSSHYAFGWKTDVPPRPLEEVTALGCRYAELKDGAEKEDLLLDLCQCFHPYLMKYLVMICRGHLPIAGHGGHAVRINKDIKPFLYFLPKGQRPGASVNLSKVSRQLHLAFKGMETADVYDVLIMHLMSAINGYDPHCKRKVKLVVETIQMSYRRGNNSQPLTSTATWTLIAIAVSACWCALASSQRPEKRPGRRII